jgi:hypothetical protein
MSTLIVGTAGKSTEVKLTVVVSGFCAAASCEQKVRRSIAIMADVERVEKVIEKYENGVRGRRKRREKMKRREKRKRCEKEEKV